MRGRVAGRIFFLAVAVCVCFPLLILCVWCFAGRWSWPALLPSSASLRGLRELWRGGALRVLGSSATLSSAVAALSVIIGVMTARGLVFYEFPGKQIVYFAALLPLIVPSTVFAMGTHILFVQAGLDDTVTGILIAQLICSLPYSVSILLDVTRAQGGKLEEQARVLGAGPWESFFRVTVPALVPAALSAGIMAYIISFSQYFLTLLLGGGNVRTYTVIMVPFLQGSDRAIASAYSLMFLLVSLGVFLIFEFFVKRFYAGGNQAD